MVTDGRVAWKGADPTNFQIIFALDITHRTYALIFSWFSFVVLSFVVKEINFECQTI